MKKKDIYIAEVGELNKSASDAITESIKKTINLLIENGWTALGGTGYMFDINDDHWEDKQHVTINFDAYLNIDFKEKVFELINKKDISH